jgi:hypothetical protein
MVIANASVAAVDVVAAAPLTRRPKRVEQSCLIP